MPQTTDQDRAAFEAWAKDHTSPSQYRTIMESLERGESLTFDAFQAGRAVPLVAEAPREPVAWMWQHGETGMTGFVQHAPDDELRQWERMNKPRKIVSPLYAALPASLAPMPEEPPQPASLSDEAADEILRGSEWTKWSDARDMIQSVYAKGRKSVSHLRTAPRQHPGEPGEDFLERTAPRPTLSDEQIDAFLPMQFGCVGNVATWHRGQIREVVRALLAASASPQQPEQKTDSFHLAEGGNESVGVVDDEPSRIVQCRQCLAITSEGNGCAQLGCPVGAQEVPRG